MHLIIGDELDAPEWILGLGGRFIATFEYSDELSVAGKKTSGFGIGDVETIDGKARNRDIAALLARGVVRVKKQTLVAKAIESQIPAKHDVSKIEYEGQRYKLLTSIAKDISGSHCKGFLFFQLGRKV